MKGEGGKDTPDSLYAPGRSTYMTSASVVNVISQISKFTAGALDLLIKSPSSAQDGPSE